MRLRNIAPGLAGLLGLALIGLGVLFMAFPDAGARLFGIGASGQGAIAYIQAVAIRDVASGLMLVVLSRYSNRKLLAFALLMLAVVAHTDMILVLLHGGPAIQAFGLHGAASLLILVLVLIVYK
jgi:hypothetical protein